MTVMPTSHFQIQRVKEPKTSARVLAAEFARVMRDAFALKTVEGAGNAG
jgi:hypothetical protein